MRAIKGNVQGLPAAMLEQYGHFVWSYGDNEIYGYSGTNTRVAVSINNKEIALPLRAIYTIRKKPQDYNGIIEASLIRRDVLEKKVIAEWKRGKNGPVYDVIMYEYRFSTGAHSHVKFVLPFTSSAQIGCRGIIKEGYNEPEEVGQLHTKIVQGFSKASYYKVDRNWQRVKEQAYEMFDFIDAWIVYEFILKAE